MKSNEEEFVRKYNIVVGKLPNIYTILEGAIKKEEPDIVITTTTLLDDKVAEKEAKIAVNKYLLTEFLKEFTFELEEVE